VTMATRGPPPPQDAGLAGRPVFAGEHARLIFVGDKYVHLRSNAGIAGCHVPFAWNANVETTVHPRCRARRQIPIGLVVPGRSFKNPAAAAHRIGINSAGMFRRESSPASQGADVPAIFTMSTVDSVWPVCASRLPLHTPRSRRLINSRQEQVRKRVVASVPKKARLPPPRRRSDGGIEGVGPRKMAIRWLITIPGLGQPRHGTGEMSAPYHLTQYAGWMRPGKDGLGSWKVSGLRAPYLSS